MTSLLEAGNSLIGRGNTMAINFPNSPSINDSFVHNNVTYTWDGDAWRSIGMPYDAVTESSLSPYLGKNALVAQTPATPDSIDDEFTTSLNTTTKWTVRSGSASNATITAHGLNITNTLWMTQPISGSTWQITMRMCVRNLESDVGCILAFGNTATSQAVYFGGYHRAGNGSYPLFYSATMPLAGGWTATASSASTASPGWINYAKLMNHRVTLASGTLTYTIGEDSCPQSYRAPHPNNTYSIAGIGNAVDVVGIYHPGALDSLVEFFRKTA